MKVAVYGTLKRGFHNNTLLMHSRFLEERIIPGYKLMDAGFPVAVPCNKSSIKAEIFEIDDDDKVTLVSLDRLEGEGHMYNRIIVDDMQMYVGNPKFWNRYEMDEIPSSNNVYEYQKKRYL